MRPRAHNLDPPIAGLVEALNALPGIETSGSCAGHENPTDSQWPADEWFVTFTLQPADDQALTTAPSPEAWLSLEWLAWMLNNNLRRSERSVLLVPSSPPPYMNHAGRALRFAIEGRRGEHGLEPAELCERIEQLAPELYIPVEELESAQAVR